MKEKKLLKVVLLVLMMIIASSSVSFGVTHPAKYAKYTKYKGIDVSEWQGSNIDFKKVKAAGYKFVFIRIGYTSLSSATIHSDSYFKTNIAKAQTAGLKVGVYYYGQAISTTEAKKEADFVISSLKGYKLELPVVYDFEKPSGDRLATNYSKWVESDGKTYARKKCTNIVLAFMDRVKASGHSVMFYSYRSLMDKWTSWCSSSSCLNMESIDSKYPVWIAQYSTDISYPRDFSFWQYSSTTKVSGISGNVDVNYWYYLKGYDLAKCSVSAIADQGYTGSVVEPKVTVKSGTTKLTEGTDYNVTYTNNIKQGTATATITGMNTSVNSITKTFNIVKGTPTITTSKSAFTKLPASDANKTFSLEAKTSGESSLDFNTNDESIASVDDYGNVTPTGKCGTATITLASTASDNYNAASKTVTITTAKGTPGIKTSATSYARNPSSVAFNLNASKIGDGALTYKSDNTAVATVDANGLVTTTTKVGTANITVTSSATADYTSESKTVKVTVAKLTPTITASSKTKYYGNSAFYLGAKVSYDRKLTYSSSSKSVATINSSGKVTIKGEGKTTITIKATGDTTYNTITKKITITVKPPKQAITYLKKYKYGYFKIKFKKDAKASGYQIQYATNSRFTGNQTSKYVSKTTTSKNIKVYYPKKKYYVRVRSYKYVGKTKLYGSWSSTKKVYTK